MRVNGLFNLQVLAQFEYNQHLFKFCLWMQCNWMFTVRSCFERRGTVLKLYHIVEILFIRGERILNLYFFSFKFQKFHNVSLQSNRFPNSCDTEYLKLIHCSCIWVLILLTLWTISLFVAIYPEKIKQTKRNMKSLKKNMLDRAM